MVDKPGNPAPEERDDAEEPNEPPADNPLAQLFSQLGLGSQGDDLASLLEELQQTINQLTSHMTGFAQSGGESSGANWDFAKDVARKTVAQHETDPAPSERDQRDIQQAVALANLWLDQAISFPQLPGDGVAWSRALWVENTFEVWQRLVGPIVASISNALVEVTRHDHGQTESMQAMLQPMMRSAAAAMFGGQVGQAIGMLAIEALSGTDVSLPVAPAPTVALLPTNLAKFSEGLEQPASDVRLYLALREVARQRLFGTVGWLAPQMLALVEHYAREIVIDPSGLGSALEERFSSDGLPDFSQIEDVGRDFASKLFKPDKTPEQIEVLARLETLLALVEGWVEDTVTQAVSTLMPNAAPLLEVLRRRRAAGGPSEQALRTLIGLELRPRRVRDAENLWAALRTSQGTEARDAAWAHPDLAPTSADLDDPLGYAEHGHLAEPDSMDAELAKLLAEGETDNPPQS